MSDACGVLEQTLNTVDGPIDVSLIVNPTIEDVLVAEVEIQAMAILNKDGSADNRQVSYDIRDFLIRLGINR